MLETAAYASAKPLFDIAVPTDSPAGKHVLGVYFVYLQRRVSRPPRRQTGPLRDPAARRGESAVCLRKPRAARTHNVGSCSA